jgi:hypothetical protein
MGNFIVLMLSTEVIIVPQGTVSLTWILDFPNIREVICLFNLFPGGIHHWGVDFNSLVRTLFQT